MRSLGSPVTFLAPYLPGKRLSRDAYLLCFSAFFADLGYQGVAALFPLYVVFRLHAAVYAYGLITAIAFGGGSIVSYIGGLAGDRFDRKAIAIAGNALIPLMAFAGMAQGLWASSAFFILGWWARYFRTPARRALLVNVTRPQERSLAFGFLHALDIGGGMLSALLALLFLGLRLPVGTIILFAILPLAVSTRCSSSCNGPSFITPRRRGLWRPRAIRAGGRCWLRYWAPPRSMGSASTISVFRSSRRPAVTPLMGRTKPVCSHS
jgi:MFS family permease